MNWMLIACSLWTCAPIPLAEGLTLKRCLVLAQEMKIEDVVLKCEKMK